MSKFPDNSQFRISADFSNRLKLIIDENDCESNKQFAALVGVSVPVISKAINFGIIPSLRTLIKIADKLELSIKYLLGLDDKNDFIPSSSPSTFHKRLEELTAEKKINYGQLASKMCFPRTYIYEWIKENTLPSIDYIFNLSKYFGVTPDYLLGRSDYKK